MAHAQPTFGVPSRIEKLNVAASLHQFDRALNRSAWGSLGWGAFCIVIGWVLLSRNPLGGWLNIGVGALLMIEGLYEKRVREPKVIVVAAATLGILGLWNLTGLIIGLMTHTRVTGHPVAAILQLAGAWTTYAAYSTYATLLSSSDPGTNLEFSNLVEQLKTADPATAPEIVEFTSHKFGNNDVRWRAKRVDDLFLFLGNELMLGRKQSKVTCFFVPRRQVKIDITGEKMFGRNQKATITIGTSQLKATIGADIAHKFLSMLA